MEFVSVRQSSMLPSISIVVVLMVAIIIDLDLSLWRSRDRVIEHDVHGYYAYLPALIIYDDIKLEKSDYREGDYYYFWPNFTPEGHRLIKYTAGSAILYSPFFLFADILSGPLGHARTGFSVPYKIALLVNALFYLAAGLFLIQGLLIRSGHSQRVTALTLLCLGIGTNLLCYSSVNGAMPHVHGFFLVSAILVLSIRWRERPAAFNTILLGIVIGLAVMVRPVLIIYSLIPLFLLVTSGGSFLGELRNRAKWIALMALSAGAMLLPQLFYWYEVTGSWVYYSYQDEGFFWDRPVILRGLIGFQKGWLTYTPIMFIALCGLIVMKNRMRNMIIILLALHVYITFSWWCWWYGGTFGQRAMIETYGLLALPLAAWLAWLEERGGRVRLAGLVMIGFLIVLNIYQTYQYERGSIHYEAMTRQAYQAQFLRMEKVEGFEELLSYPDYEAAKKGFAR